MSFTLFPPASAIYEVIIIWNIKSLQFRILWSCKWNRPVTSPSSNEHCRCQLNSPHTAKTLCCRPLEEPPLHSTQLLWLPHTHLPACVWARLVVQLLSMLRAILDYPTILWKCLIEGIKTVAGKGAGFAGWNIVIWVTRRVTQGDDSYCLKLEMKQWDWHCTKSKASFAISSCLYCHNSFFQNLGRQEGCCQASCGPLSKERYT